MSIELRVMVVFLFYDRPVSRNPLLITRYSLLATFSLSISSERP